MLTKDNLHDALLSMGFKETLLGELEYQPYSMSVNLKDERLVFPPNVINRERNTDFSHPENFVVFECVFRLLQKGYRPEDLELEKQWTLGHTSKGGRADIIVYESKAKSNDILCIIECKTAGGEYKNAKQKMLADGGQLFGYWQQERSCKWMILYTSDFVDEKITYTADVVSCFDDPNIEQYAENNKNIHLYKNATSQAELFAVWRDTYDQRILPDVLFHEDTVAYKIGVRPLKKKDLRDFSENDAVANKFEEILRHNNVSDKENAFNRLVALFICKLVDEIEKKDEDIVEFQFKVGTDTYEDLQDRLQRLHRDGMQKFMREEIFYVPDDYARNIISQYTGQNREQLIENLQKTIRTLKFYSNNDFAFKDVHNKELFYQNGKILVEVVSLFQNFRIIGSNDLQFLGNLFEQLLNKGFKQNEGQFFTPIPIVSFIWNSLPLDKFLNENIEYPRIIDFACGAGHFLTEGYQAVVDVARSNNKHLPSNWSSKGLFGIEKDYRLARVSKIALFMHGAGEGNIVFGDGLDCYSNKTIDNFTFDILVANPPYSVNSFKPHLDLKDNNFKSLKYISENGSEIEVLFVERISQVLKPKGVGAVILPSSLLNKDQESYIAARQSLLENFKIRCITSLGSKTFSETGTNTVVLFLEKFIKPPKKIDLAKDSVSAIFHNLSLDNWVDKDIFENYLKRISVDKTLFTNFLNRVGTYTDYEKSRHFRLYIERFKTSSELKDLKKKKYYKLKNEEEQKLEESKVFFTKYHEIERSKLLIFSLIYNQKTLLISSPSDTEGQEKFLGYSWSKRKGQEGIQILNAGSKLYSVEDRNDPNKLAYLIKKSFSDNMPEMPEDLTAYYSFVDTQLLIDFDSQEFSNIIRTTPVKFLKDDPSLTTLDLSDGSCFKISIGKRVLNNELVKKSSSSIPVYSANVYDPFGYIDSKLLDDFSKPSILWGIDGDWMVNLLPANVDFYPTDHCGVIRVLTDKILREYLRYALFVEGQRLRFCRSYRASAERVKQIYLQVPSIEIQQRHVDAVRTYDERVQKADEAISSVESVIEKEFDKMFGVANRQTPLSSLRHAIEIKKGTLFTRQDAIAGNVPVVAGGKTPSCYHNQANRPENTITVSASGAYAGYINFWDIPIFASDCNTLRSLDNNVINIVYLYYALRKQQQALYDRQVGSSQPHVYENDIAGLQIYVPPIAEQNKFADFVASKSTELKTFKEEKRLAEMQRNDYIEQNFN